MVSSYHKVEKQRFPIQNQDKKSDIEYACATKDAIEAYLHNSHEVLLPLLEHIADAYPPNARYQLPALFLCLLTTLIACVQTALNVKVNHHLPFLENNPHKKGIYHLAYRLPFVSVESRPFEQYHAVHQESDPDHDNNPSPILQLSYVLYF